ncbi:MAG: acetyl-CoA hydrolase/transferase C-terminal domain-containing protein [Acidimicrobiales bacterium]
MEIVDEGVVAERLRGLPSPEPRVVVGGNFATPWELVRLADANLERWRAFVINAQPGWPDRDGVVTETPFVGPGARYLEGLDYLPMRLSLVPKLFSSMRPPDAVLLHTSSPRGGKVSLGVEVNILPAAIEQVRSRGGLVIAQVNARMPYTYGDAEIDVDHVDYGIEVDGALSSPVERSPDDADRVIGERVASLASDGGTLQMGIGQLPDAAVNHMRDRRNMGVWSELVSDGIIALERSGVLDTARPVTASFLFGSAELYEWAHSNPRLVMRRTEVVNNPARISQQPAMLSINTAIEVDLYAQANASYVRGSIFSGFGGQPDFVIGALHSVGGQSVICLRSWHEKSDTSTIVPMLRQPVCSFQHSVVVTEQGLAPIFGRSQRAQARLLINEAAHPSARASLWDAATSLGLVSSK